MYSRLTFSTNLRGICPWSQPRAPTTGPHCSSYFRSQTSIHGYAMSTKPQQGEFDSTVLWTLALQKPSCRELAELLRIQLCNGICFVLRSEASSRKSPFKWARPSSAHVFPKDPGTTKRSFGDQPSGPLPSLCSPGFARPSPVTGVHRAHSAWGPFAAGKCQKPGLGSADGSVYPCPPFLWLEVVQSKSALSGKFRFFPSDPSHLLDLRVPSFAAPGHHRGSGCILT